MTVTCVTPGVAGPPTDLNGGWHLWSIGVESWAPSGAAQKAEKVHQIQHEGRKSMKQELEKALALSNQLGDPCWQAASARTLTLARVLYQEK